MIESGVYLYAVARNPEPDRLASVTGRLAGVATLPVRTVPRTGLVAVVSTVPLGEFGEQPLRRNLEDLAWVEETARAHHAVVALVARHAATAPVRLATVFHSDERVLDLLAERRAEIDTALSWVAGHAEWGVKAYGVPETPGADGTATPGRVNPGTAYLQRRRSQRSDRERSARRMAARAEEVFSELGSYAVAARRHPPQDPRLSRQAGVMLLNAAYLVGDQDGDAFVARAEELDGRLDDVRVEVTGPWPAYSFISLGEA